MGQSQAIRRACEKAGYDPETVGLVEAHGTGTRAGDTAELRGLTHVFRREYKSRYCALGSVKSQVGHTKAAAGAAGLFKAVMALHHKILPPTLHVDQPAELLLDEDTPFYLNSKSRPWFRRDPKVPRRAGVSSFGFGGSNFHVALEEYTGPAQKKPLLKRSCPYEIFVWGSDTAETLFSEVRSFVSDTQLYQDTSFSWFSKECQQAFYPGSQVRLSVVAGDMQDLRGKLSRILEAGQNGLTSLNIEGVSAAEGKPAGGIGFVFSGQGSQYCGMGAELGCWFPEVLGDWEKLASLLGEDGNTLLSRMLPPMPRSSDEEQAQSEQLTETEWAQPALGLISIALSSLLTKAGVKPDLVAGHSYGELAALYAANVLSEDCLYCQRAIDGRCSPKWCYACCYGLRD